MSPRKANSQICIPQPRVGSPMKGIQNRVGKPPAELNDAKKSARPAAVSNPPATTSTTRDARNAFRLAAWAGSRGDTAANKPSTAASMRR